MYCIFCGHFSEDDSLKVCPNCGKNFYKDVSALKQSNIPSMRVVSGSPEMITKIPSTSPVSNAQTSVKASYGMARTLTLIALCVFIVVAGFFTIKHVFIKQSGEQKNITTSAGIFSGRTNSNIPFQTRVDAGSNRIYTDDKSAYCFQESGVHGVKINAKTGEVTNINENRHNMEYASVAGKYIFFLSGKDISDLSADNNTLYAYDTKSGKIKSFDEIDCRIKKLSSDGKSAYFYGYKSNKKCGLFKVDSDSLKVTEIDTNEDWLKDHQHGFCIYNDKVYYSYSNRKASDGIAKFGIKSYDIKTQEFKYEHGMILDACLNDKGFLILDEGFPTFLPHDGSGERRLADIHALNFNLSGNYVYFLSEEILYRVKIDGSDLKRIPLEKDIVLRDVSDEWILALRENMYTDAYRIEDNKITMAVHNIYGIMNNEPYCEKLDISLETVN